MVENYTKTIALVYSAVLITLFILPFDIRGVGMIRGDLLSHITYQHFHGSILHLACNIWALLTFVFIVRTPWYKFIAAFVASMLYPFATDKPIVGISGILFAVAGMYVFRPRTWRLKLRYYTIFAIPLIAGFFLPGVGAGLHLFCFAAGVLYALVTEPIIKLKSNE